MKEDDLKAAEAILFDFEGTLVDLLSARPDFLNKNFGELLASLREGSS